MAINVHFDIEMTSTEGVNEDAWLDPQETRMMLDHTRAQIDAHIQRALGTMHCPTHSQPPQVTVKGRYDSDQEELDISYDVQTCCNVFLAQCIAALNRR